MKKYTKEVISTAVGLTSILTLLYIMHITPQIGMWQAQQATPVMCALKVGSFVIPPESMAQVSKKIQSVGNERDDYKLIRGEEIRNYLQGQIFLANVIGELVPGTNMALKDSEILKANIKKLLDT